MTIREVETLTGMTRANIRFYESEGMLRPARGENGYRDYSQADVELLMKVRLLRMLDISIDEIKRIQRGEVDMPRALDAQINRLTQQQKTTGEKISLCRTMRDDHAEFATLDARHYIDVFGNYVQIRQDELPRVRAPWRRWFARSIDYALYVLAADVFLLLVARISPLHSYTPAERLAQMLLAMLMMLFVEPFFLSRLGSTPGKALMGLHVSSLDGGRMCYSDALERTAGALWRGQGFSIPIYGWIREWKSYTACSDGEALPWEAGSVLELRDKRAWRWFSYPGVLLVCWGAMALLSAVLLMPPNRGELTIAEFAENYNHALDVLEIDLDHYLGEDGKWVQKSYEDMGYVVIDLSASDALYEFEYETEGDVLRAVRFNVEAEGQDTVFHPANHLVAAAYAFVRAQKDYPLLGNVLPEFVQHLSETPMQSFAAEACGVRVSCAVDNLGYVDAMGLMWFIPDNEPVPEDAHLSIQFEMKLAEE